MNNQNEKVKAVLGKDGFYESPNKEFCQNCGRKTKTAPIVKGIWNYGTRTEKTLQLCKACEDF